MLFAILKSRHKYRRNGKEVKKPFTMYKYISIESSIFFRISPPEWKHSLLLSEKTVCVLLPWQQRTTNAQEELHDKNIGSKLYPWRILLFLLLFFYFYGFTFLLTMRLTFYGFYNSNCAFAFMMKRRQCFSIHAEGWRVKANDN